MAYTGDGESGLTRARRPRARVEQDEKLALALRRDLYRMRASVCFEFSEYYKCLYIIIIECYYSLCQRFDLLHLVLDRLARISGSGASSSVSCKSVFAYRRRVHGESRASQIGPASPFSAYTAFDQFNLFHLAFK